MLVLSALHFSAMSNQRFDTRFKREVKLWWTVWMIATIGTPSSILFVGRDDSPYSDNVAAELMLLAVGLSLHAIACRKLDQRSQEYLTLVLLLGGWGVMLSVFAAGCISLLGSSLH